MLRAHQSFDQRHGFSVVLLVLDNDQRRLHRMLRRSNRLGMHVVVLPVRSEEKDDDDAVEVLHLADQAVIVGLDSEDDPPTLENAGLGISSHARGVVRADRRGEAEVAGRAQNQARWRTLGYTLRTSETN